MLGAEGRYRLDQQPLLPLRLGAGPRLSVGPLRMYTCGITPYDVTHVGHAATFVWADLVATLAHATGVETVVARNITDIDDVLTRAARSRGRPFDELALTQEFHFDRDMRALAVAAPTLTPRARAHVPTVVRLASALLSTGTAYLSEGFVYFRGEEVPGRAGLDPEEALEASREYGDQDGAPGRESVFDVALWRPSAAEDPAWPSPWGWGRPGWHAECAAMAVSSLGAAVDVLLGGADLSFPHHAYQVAMVETATGVRPFAGEVVHVGEVRRGGRKMAKSTGNLVLVSELLERHHPAAVRLGLLHRPVGEPWECTDEVFSAAATLLSRLSAAAPERASSAPADRDILARLSDGLDVTGAVELALDRGGAAAASLLELLKLRPPG